MKRERISFPGGSGHELAAWLDLPAAGEPVGWALFAHCFTCSKDLRAVREITGALAARGIATLRFDFTGLGRSEGDFSDTTFASNLDDLVAAADWMEAQRCRPQLLVGHSLGGCAVVHAAHRIPGAKAIATIASPFDPVHVRKLLAEKRDEIEALGEAEVVLAGRTFRIKRKFLEDIERYDPTDVFHDLKRALLILHSPKDQDVGVDNARSAFASAMHPKSFVSLDGADHLLSNPADAAYAGAMIAAWAMRYIDADDPAPPLDSEGAQVAVHTGAEGFRTDVAAGKHHLVADEPESYGGTDLGPSPYDFLMTSLGACTSMTLRMYADRKGWPLTGATVRLEHSKIHVRDCEDCETEGGRVDQITRVLTLEGDLDEVQRARLLEIADKCPVHRTLHNEVKVRTELA